MIQMYLSATGSVSAKIFSFASCFILLIDMMHSIHMQQGDTAATSDAAEAFAHDNLDSNASLEDLCRSHLVNQHVLGCLSMPMNNT